jgi:hypothetical protein
MDTDREALIRERAHELWERDGCPEGRAEAHWCQAEQQVLAEAAARETPQAGGPEDEPRIWGIADAAAQGDPSAAAPAAAPAEVATAAGDRARRRRGTDAAG